MSEQRESVESGSQLKISLFYGELKVDFSGSPEHVMRSLNSFVSERIPELNLAKKLILNYNSVELAKEFQDYVKITPEGPRVITDEKLSDRELVAARLLAQKIAFETGNASSLSLPLLSLVESTALNPKTLSSRLSELAKLGYVIRESSGEITLFRISTEGIRWLKESLAKKRVRKN